MSITGIVQKAQSPPRGQASPPHGIAFIVSAFPTVTETFILYELKAMEDLGVKVELYPLRRLHPRVTHPEAAPWIRRAHYRPFLSWAVIRAQWHFICSRPGRYFKTWLEILRGTWGSVNFFCGAIAIFPKAALFALEMMESRVGHVHAHFANHPAVAALIIHRLTEIPYSFTARGTDVQVDRHMLKQKVRAAHFAIAVCSFNQKILLEEGGPDVCDKVHVIYGGVDLDRLVPHFMSRSGCAFRILCVGRFEEVKGHRILIDACRLLRDHGIPFECRLIGEGPLFPMVEKRVRRGNLSNQVRLLGPRTHSEVIEELRNAEVVALPTEPTVNGKREGIPNVLKEAMACGLPVVATRVGGIPELVEHDQTGILVPVGNPVALAAALRRLYENPGLRRRLGSAAREKVVREFDLRVSTAKRAKLFLRSAGAEGVVTDPSICEQIPRPASQKLV